jgi:hypothetical protein
MRKQMMTGILMVLVVVGMVGFVSAQDNETLPEIDPEIYEAFENQTEVFVIVTLKADFSSNHSSSIKNSEERAKWLEDITRQVDETQSKVVPFLLESEFRVESASELSPVFSGYMSKEGLEKLKNNPLVTRIEKVKKTYASLDDSASLINATRVWNDLNYTGEGITVCVVDTGINYTHPGLGGCSPTNNISDGSCWKVIGGYDFRNNDSDPVDDNGHGTNVAGIVASTDETYKGIANNSKLTAVKVLDQNGNGNTNDLKDGIEWCRINADTYNISIITISVNHDAFVEKVEYAVVDYDNCNEVTETNPNGDEETYLECQTKTESGVYLDLRIEKHEQAIYELLERLDELCLVESSYSWCA